MKEFKTDLRKTNKLKWLIFILIEISLLIYILKFSDWNFFFKFILFIPIFVFLIFDLIYLKQENNVITELSFEDNDIITLDNKKVKTVTSYKNLKYSIRKSKFNKHKTEIELKTNKNFRYKTFCRIHIKNWKDIFEIEKTLESLKIERTKWKHKTIWGKYWGIIIEIFFLTTTDSGGFGGEILDYQERIENENIENPIKKKNNA